MHKFTHQIMVVTKRLASSNPVIHPVSPHSLSLPTNRGTLLKQLAITCIYSPLYNLFLNNYNIMHL